jgi:transposase InsO family protein
VSLARRDAERLLPWRVRPESAHARRDRHIKVLIRASFEAHKSRSGSPRIYGDLQEAKEPVSKKRVVRLMQEDGLKARPRKRFKCTTLSDTTTSRSPTICSTDSSPPRRRISDGSTELTRPRNRL